jgi:SAM-dependent methyltransferase
MDKNKNKKNGLSSDDSIRTYIWDTILSKARQAHKKRGLYYVISTGAKMILDLPGNYFFLWYHKSFKSSETFEFQGNTYHYLFHSYYTSWKNERAVAIPIAWDIVTRYQEKKKRILEVGNILSYIYKVNHDILDKYETKDGIINKDVVDFSTSEQYDLIICILTLQHVGWYESPRDPTKVVYAIENLKRFLAPGGQMVIVHGLGENLEMDDLMKNGILQFHQLYFLKRISSHRWKQVQLEDVKDVKYDYSTPRANGLVIGIFDKE